MYNIRLRKFFHSKSFRLAISIAGLFLAINCQAQVVYEDINNTGIYEFLDEMANLNVITLNSVVKPYSRGYISEKLQEVMERTGGTADKRTSGQADGRTGKKVVVLNKRQMKELLFYWQDYQLDLRCESSNSKNQGGSGVQKFRSSENSDSLSIDPVSDCYLDYAHKLGFLFKKQPTFAVPLNPLAFQYKDRLFTLSVRPVGGIFFMTNENGNMYQRYWGGAAFMYIGKYFGGYARLRDNYATELLSQPEYLTPATGGVYKLNEGGRKGGDWSEMRGGITVSWRWGSFGLMKDFFAWGNNYNGSNILSGHAPSFPYIQLHLKPVKWFEFYYIHGWLVSKVVDSTRSYWVDDTYRIIYHNKYIAANMFTVSPWKRLNISFGNSIIYSGDINPAFLIPFMFFKSVDHATYFENNAGSNAQMFFDISSRQIKHLHVFITLFIDELTARNILDKDKFNFTSWKFGFRESNFLVNNLSITGEYTMTRPFTYQHYISTTTFTSNRYNMGHYMRDNSQEIYFSVSYKPLRGLQLNTSCTIAEHGDDFVYMEYPGKYIQDGDAFPFLKNKTWQNFQAEFKARYELVSGIYLWAQYLWSNRQGDVSFGPEILHGNTNSFLAGINIGF